MQYITPTAAGVNAAGKELTMLIESLRMKRLYRKDADFKRYVERYCQSRGFNLKEALRHALVKETAKYYMDENRKQKATEIFHINIDILT